MWSSFISTLGFLTSSLTPLTSSLSFDLSYTAAVNKSLLQIISLVLFKILSAKDG